MTSRTEHQAPPIPAEADSGQAPPIPADQAGYLIATACRAPSVHNTQPWRFKDDPGCRIGSYADQRRKLHVDPVGREMLISCGAALFGLRLAVRSLGLPAGHTAVSRPGPGCGC